MTVTEWDRRHTEEEYAAALAREYEEAPDEDAPATYEIVRYRFEAGCRVIRSGLTLEEAQAHCSDDATQGDGWFDGYREER